MRKLSSQVSADPVADASPIEVVVAAKPVQVGSRQMARSLVEQFEAHFEALAPVLTTEAEAQGRLHISAAYGSLPEPGAAAWHLTQATRKAARACGQTSPV